jgi:tetratricopeptide (TPR) repeat protein
VTGRELDPEVRSELLTLSKEGAEAVSRHLVVAGRLFDDDPEAAYRHAMAAQRRAGRVGVVREAAGLAAYRTGRYDEALRELRTARRLTGSDEHWPVMADCERGLGRPERALAMASAPETERLSPGARLEMRIVVAGARSDLGQHDAAVLVLQVPELTTGAAPADVRARLQSAYADALEAAGRTDEARAWLERAAATDPDGSTGAAERLGLPGDGGAEDDGEMWDLLCDAGRDAGRDDGAPGT